MHIEKRNLKMFNTITIIVLAAILLTVIGGLMIQRQAMPARAGGTGMRTGDNPIMRPEQTQTGPTGRLVVNTGIILLMIGFGVILLLLLVRRNLAHRNIS